MGQAERIAKFEEITRTAFEITDAQTVRGTRKPSASAERDLQPRALQSIPPSLL